VIHERYSARDLFRRYQSRDSAQVRSSFSFLRVARLRELCFIKYIIKRYDAGREAGRTARLSFIIARRKREFSRATETRISSGSRGRYSALIPPRPVLPTSGRERTIIDCSPEFRSRFSLSARFFQLGDKCCPERETISEPSGR